MTRLSFRSTAMDRCRRVHVGKVAGLERTARKSQKSQEHGQHLVWLVWLMWLEDMAGVQTSLKIVI